MATRAQKTKVGIFLVGCLVLMVAAALVVSGFKRGSRTPYWMEFRDESILGLNRGSLVEYLGVPVGKVENITVTPENRAHVELQIEDDKVVLREGVRAQLVIYSLATGMMAVSLKGGEPSSPPLPPESEIPVEPSLFASSSGNVAELLDRLNSIADDVRRGMEGIKDGQITETLDDFNGAIKDARDFMAEAKDAVRKIGDEADGSMKDARAALREVRDEIGPLSEKTGRLIDNLDSMVTTAADKLEPLQLAQTEQNVQEALRAVTDLADTMQTTVEGLGDKGETLVHKVDNMEFTIRETLRTLNETLEAFRGLAEHLERDPSSIVYGTAPRRDR